MRGNSKPPSRTFIKAALLGLGVGAALSLAGQPAPESNSLRFEVASVKVTEAGCAAGCGLIRSTPGGAGYHAEGATLRSLMTVAYGVTDRQISGGSKWMESERFDIDAKADRARNIDELHAMLAHLLEDRFHLAVRRESRQESVWNLTLSDHGTKMPPHDPSDRNYPPINIGWVTDHDGSVCASAQGVNETMEYLAFSLSRNMNTTVIDRTGLSGRYDVNLRFMPDGVHPKSPAGTPLAYSSDCLDVFAALPAQLGLRLVAGKGPVEYLVVEHVEPLKQN